MTTETIQAVSVWLAFLSAVEGKSIMLKCHDFRHKLRRNLGLT